MQPANKNTSAQVKTAAAWPVIGGVVCLLLSVISVWTWQPGESRSTKGGVKSFGEQQLRQILNDRPTMSGIFDSSDFTYQWVIRQFDRGDASDRVIWAAHEPLSGRPAEYVRAYNGAPATVSLTVDPKVSARDKWFMLVYELHNVRYAGRIEKLEDLAIAGEMDRDRFCDECLSAELEAMAETQEFFRSHPIPGASAKSDPFYSRYLIGSTDMARYKLMLAKQRPDEYNPRDYFGKRFDELQGTARSPWNAVWDLLETL